MRLNYKPIGKYIREVDNRNAGLKVKQLLGLSISKQFIPSVANIIGTDMENYKIIRKNQFACSTMQVRRDKKMPVALLQEVDEAIISQAYPIFEVVDEKLLLPEYLMMWFTRTEFDREACFYAIGGVRGSLEWEDFLVMQLPIPSITKQKEIVAEYNTIQSRIYLNQQLIQKLEETAQAIYKNWFVDFEFPDENGKPYKSNGGEMVVSELGEIPKGWVVGTLKAIMNYSNSRIELKTLNLNTYISTENMIQDRGGIIPANSLPSALSITKFVVGEILISNIRPYFKKIWLAEFIGGCSNDILCISPKKGFSSLFLFYILEQDMFFEYVMAGSKGTKMPRGDKNWIMNYSVVIPDTNILTGFTKTAKVVSEKSTAKKNEKKKLEELKSLLLSKLATIEN